MIFGRKWPDLAVSLSDLRGLKGGSQNFFIKTKSLYLGLIFHNINSPFSNSTSLRQGIDFKTTRFPIFFTFSGQNRQSHPSLVEGKTITTIRIFFDKWSNIMNKLGGCDLAISGYTNFGPPPSFLQIFDEGQYYSISRRFRPFWVDSDFLKKMMGWGGGGGGSKIRLPRIYLWFFGQKWLDLKAFLA